MINNIATTFSRIYSSHFNNEFLSRRIHVAEEDVDLHVCDFLSSPSSGLNVSSPCVEKEVYYWIELIPDPVCVTDLSGEIKVCNESFSRLFHLEAGNVRQIIAKEQQKVFSDKLKMKSKEVRIAERCCSIFVKDGVVKQAFYDWSFGSDLIRDETVIIGRNFREAEEENRRSGRGRATRRGSDVTALCSEDGSGGGGGNGMDAFMSSGGGLSDSIIKEQWMRFRARVGILSDPDAERDRIKGLESRLFAKRLEILRNQSKELQEVEEARRRSDVDMRETIENRRAFLRCLLHELRTPLSVITMGLDSIHSDDASVLEFLKYTCQSVMDVLGNYTLHQNMMGDGSLRLDLKTFNILELIRETLSRFVIQATMSNIQLSLHSDIAYEAVWVCLDRNSIVQVLRNVLTDSFKFTPAGGSIDIKLSIEGVSMLQIQIKDSGFGNSKGGFSVESEAYFDPKVLEGEQGTGLGVFVARKLLELQGATAHAESLGAGLGVRFVISLPIANASFSHDVELPIVKSSKLSLVNECSSTPTKALSSDDTAAASTHSLRLLIVDDALLCRKMTIKNVASYCSECVEAGNGMLAYEAYLDSVRRGITFDGILMDFSMPIMTGTTATKLIREAGYLGKIIMITGNSLNEDVADCFAAGANKVYIKPLLPTDFHSILQDLIK